MKCPCGQPFHPTKLWWHNLKPYIGLSVVLDPVEGLRCRGCGNETLPGTTINCITTQVAARTISNESFSIEETTFLRNYLNLSQEELAKRVGRLTEDQVLRGLVYAQLKLEESNTSS